MKSYSGYIKGADISTNEFFIKTESVIGIELGKSVLIIPINKNNIIDAKGNDKLSELYYLKTRIDELEN